VVLVAGTEVQVVGFARKIIQEVNAGSDWFLFYCPDGHLLMEHVDGSREQSVFTGDGFALPDGDRFKFGTAFTVVNFRGDFNPPEYRPITTDQYSSVS